jgi:PAS domain-containing protein
MLTKTASFGKTLLMYRNVFPRQGGRAMMMAQKASACKIAELLESMSQLFRFVQEAAEAGKPVHEVELGIWQRLLALGRQALEQFLAAQGTGDVGPTFTMPDGRELKRLEDLHPRCYHSIFGEFPLDRTAYGTWEGQKIEAVPLDARLQLPESDFSYVLQDWAQALGVEHAFARAAETLQRILRLSVPVDSLERMNRQMAESVTGFRESLPAPAAKEEGEILVVTADNKGVPMRRPAKELPAGRHRKKGEKANKKQMAAVGCVYSVDPKYRTAEAVVAALFREPTAEKSSPEPVSQQKRIWSCLSCEKSDGTWQDGEETVFAWMVREVNTRRRPRQKLVCLMDGQRSLWIMGRNAFLEKGIVEILDLLHVTPRLWEAAYLFHPEGSDEAAAFVRERLLRVLRGKAGAVIGGLRQMASKRRLQIAKLRKLETICKYLQKNLSRMRYDKYLAAGYPIASGVIEGACRYVVKDRMERAGMRWTVPGAQAMLDLRTTYVNGQWEKFHNYRITREKQRLYLYWRKIKHLNWSLVA